MLRLSRLPTTRPTNVTSYIRDKDLTALDIN